jgi:AraC-like DNA-binding protein
MTQTPALLQELGADAATVLDQAGVPPDLLSDPENHIPFPLLGRLFGACIAATGQELFGLQIGLRSSTYSLGLIGALMRTAPTLRDSIMDLCINQRRFLRGGVCYLMARGDTAYWGYGVYGPGFPHREQLCDGATGAGFRFILELSGRKPEALMLARPRPAGPTTFRGAAELPLQFDAEQHAAVLPAALLNMRLPSADPGLRRELQKKLENYWTVTQPKVAEQVTRVLFGRLAAAEVSLEQVAEDLAMHPRTLNRALQAEGTSFRTLLNQTRAKVACQLLTSTRLDVTQIGLTLGYAETSGFTHAFRRTIGVTPSQWRVAGLAVAAAAAPG